MSRTSYLRRPLAALLMAAALAASVVMAVVLASPAWAATYTVNTNADSGAGSLRQAIIDANTTTGVADTINFDLGSAATITLTSGQLPTIESQFDVAGLTIDGGSANITVSGNNAVRVFEADPGAKLTLSNLTVANGANATEGGGIYNRGGMVTVSNSTLSGNSASSFGGGIDNPSGTSATLKNTIVAANNDASGGGVPDVRGVFTSQGHNLIGKSACSSGCGFTNGQNGDQVGTSANPIDPMLAPLANNGGPTMTHALLEGGPAIDKGVAVEGITTDQRGVARPQGGAPDIGSFESEFTTTGDTIKPHVSTATPTGTGIARGTNLAATFSEKMDPLSITKSTFKLFRCPSATSTNCTTQITNGTLRKSTDGLSATLNPYGTSATKLNAKTKYKAVITTGAKDMAGNALDQDQNPNNGNQPKQWTFTTGSKL